MNTEKRFEDATFAKYLRYAATALSLVSFLTTAAGMEFIVGEGNNWKGYLISFGIQAIVLVVGLKLFDMHATLIEKTIEKWKRIVLSGIIVFIFAVAVCFSSFFSYVFLANTAYSQTKTSDYNIEIDQFLTKEVKELRDYNDAIGNKILKQMRSSLTSFETIYNSIQKSNDKSVSSIVKDAGLKLYNTPIEENELISEERIEVFMGRFERDGWLEEAHRPALQQYNIAFQSFRDDYEVSLDKYQHYYNLMQSNTFNPQQAEILKNDIADSIAHIESQLLALNSIEDRQQNINNLLSQVKSIVESKYNGLSQSLKQLNNVCDSILNSNQDIVEIAGFDLTKVAKTLYSPEAVEGNEIDEAINTLKDLVSYYLQTNKNGTDKNHLQEISACIIYLEEFKNYRLLDKEIRVFEESNLRQRYVIVPDNEQNTEPLDLPKIHEYEWREKKQADIEEFIKLLKTLPNIDLLDRVLSGENAQLTSIFTESDIKSYREYINKTLDETYLIERNKLVKLNEIEQAMLFCTSDYPIMAITCIPIALFLDLTSFGIGMFLFFCKKRKMNQKKVQN